MNNKKKTENFHTVKASNSTIDEVERLMKQQADHHKYTYKGQTSVILDSLSGKYPVMNAFLVYKPSIKDAVCCVMYRSMWTFEGKATYMEDICTDSTYRGGGIGKFAVNEVGKETLRGGADHITGAVAKNNTATMGFWIKGGGYPLKKRTYGLTNLFNDNSEIKANNLYTAQKMTEPNAVLPSFLVPAIDDPTTGLFAVNDNKGDITALVLVNAKFSAGTSEKPGIMVEPVKFLKPVSEQSKKDIIKVALNAARDFAKTKGYTDHFYAFADKNCTVSNDFIKSIGTGERQEGASADSVLVCMKLPLNSPKP